MLHDDVLRSDGPRRLHPIVKNVALGKPEEQQALREQWRSPARQETRRRQFSGPRSNIAVPLPCLRFRPRRSTRRCRPHVLRRCLLQSLRENHGVGAATCKGEVFLKLLDTIPEVLEFHHMTGAASDVMRLVAVRLADLERLIERIDFHGETRTSVVMSTLSWQVTAFRLRQPKRQIAVEHIAMGQQPSTGITPSSPS